MEVHVVRHGETEANSEGRIQGLSDSPLTEAGKSNVEKVAHALKKQEYDVVFSSPLKRALDTAKLIAQEVKADIRVSTNLREICYGDWEGLPKDELREKRVWQRREQNKYTFTHPGRYRGCPGQSYADIFDRVAEFFDQLIKSDFGLILLVTHLGVVRNAKKHLEGCSSDSAVSFGLEGQELYEISIEGDSIETSKLKI